MLIIIEHLVEPIDSADRLGVGASTKHGSMNNTPSNGLRGLERPPNMAA